MDHILHYALNLASILIAGIALIFKIRALRREPSNGALRAFVLLLAAISAMLVVGNLEILIVLAKITGGSYIPQLLLHGLVLYTCFASQRWLLYWLYPPAEAESRGRRRIWVLVAALIGLVTFIWLLPNDPTMTPFSENGPWVWPYVLTFSLYLGYVEIDMARVSWRHRRMAEAHSLRLGLQLLMLGATAGVLFVINKLLFTFAHALGVTPPWRNEIANVTLVFAAITLQVVGGTLPSWAPALATWLADCRRYYRLYPLWRRLRLAMPEVGLESHPRPLMGVLRLDAFRPARVRYGLARLVTEIDDSRLRLQLHTDPVTAATAHKLAHEDGLAGDELLAVVEAARLAAGLRALSAGDPPREGSPVSDQHAGADLDAEIAWLVQVARAFTRSRIVAAALGTAGESPSRLKRELA